MNTSLALLLSLALVTPAAAPAAPGDAPPSDAPKEAGKDVPASNRVKFVPPKYPAEALARGERALVVVEVIIDESGKVAGAEVLHGTPEFSKAALEAVRQWRYEGTKVNGHPVRVRLTVPLSFATRLPDMMREPGVPELRQGAAPMPPASAGGQGATVVARVEIDAEGRVAQAVVSHGDSPWSEALLAAVHTWRFNEPEAGKPLAFEVHADFKNGRLGRVELALVHPEPVADAAASNDGGTQRMASGTAAAPTGGSTDASTAAAPAAHPASDVVPGGGSRVPTEVPAPGIPTGPPPGGLRPTPMQPTAEPRRTEVLPMPSATPAPRSAATRAPVEIVNGPQAVIPTAPLAPTAAPVIENGSSTLRDVVLGPGLPDLVRGHRPVAPPLVRIGSAYGDVVVRFSIDSGGVTALTGSEGPDALKAAAEAVVKSWVFRRTNANRVYATAHLHYGADGSSAKVDAAVE